MSVHHPLLGQLLIRVMCVTVKSPQLTSTAEHSEHSGILTAAPRWSQGAVHVDPHQFPLVGTMFATRHIYSCLCLLCEM
jgi:hypothetical protein